MSLTTFAGRHPLVTLLALSLLICGSAAVAGTRIQFGMHDEIKASTSNPHRIPDHMDPKSKSLSNEIRLVKEEVAQEVAEVSETMHSMAFQGYRHQSQPVLDYTTGTSN